MIQFRQLFYATLFFTLPLHSWSVQESAKSAYNQVASFFERSKSGIISAEYEIKPHSTIILNNPKGNVSIKTWHRNAIIVEAEKKGKEKELPNTTFSVNKEGSQTTIVTESLNKATPLPVDYSLIIPEQASITISTENGTIHIKDVQGAITAQSLSGNITIENGINSIHARAPKGCIALEQNRLPATASIFLEAYRAVKLTLSNAIDANLTAKTLSGKVTSDLFITIDPITTQLNKLAWKRMQQEVRGAIGSGGAPITVDVTKGNVILLEQ